MLNRVQLIGNLGQDVIMRYTPEGKAVANFSMATSRKYQGKEETTWHNIVVWGKTAESCNQYLSKGRRAYVEGRLQTRSWEGDDGQRRTKTEIVADRVLFLDRGDVSNHDTPIDDDDQLPF